MLLFWIALAVWAVGALRENRRSSAGEETPLEILRRRYADGEIGLQEFEQAVRTLA